MDGSRASITLVTSLWASGESGPLTVVVPNGFLTDQKKVELQKKYGQGVYFLATNRSSHFMHTETVINFFDQVLVDTFDRRRQELGERYGRDFEPEWGCLLADSFTGHHSAQQGADLQRDLATHGINDQWKTFTYKRLNAPDASDARCYCNQRAAICLLGALTLKPLKLHKKRPAPMY